MFYELSFYVIKKFNLFVFRYVCLFHNIYQYSNTSFLDQRSERNLSTFMRLVYPRKVSDLISFVLFN